MAPTVTCPVWSPQAHGFVAVSLHTQTEVGAALPEALGNGAYEQASLCATVSCGGSVPSDLRMQGQDAPPGWQQPWKASSVGVMTRSESEKGAILRHPSRNQGHCHVALQRVSQSLPLLSQNRHFKDFCLNSFNDSIHQSQAWKPPQ